MGDCRRNDAPPSPKWDRWLRPRVLADPAGTRHAPSGRDENAAVPTPGADAVIDALASTEPDPDGVTHAIAFLAWERAADHPDLACALDDLDELWDILESAGDPPIPRSRARHCLVDAWVDAVAAERGSPGVDPLSGLHTAGYLYGRVQELDRSSHDPYSSLVLIVVRWDTASGPWLRIARIMQVASALRSDVRRGATLSQIGTRMAVALVPDDAAARVERHALTKTLEQGELNSAHVQVDVFAVPDIRSQLPDFLTQLHDQANLDHVTGLPSSRHSGNGPPN